MSTGKRAYDLLRGYVNREWERIQGLERTQAENELYDSLPKTEKTYVPGQPVAKDDTLGQIQQRLRACQILGVTADADFDTIRKSFERLNRRSEPSNFPAGSPEARHAADIQKQVNWAYELLTDDVDVTERRFRSLEID